MAGGQICIVNAVYPPEPVVSARMGHDLATHLAERGETVTVLCPYPSRPFGVTYGNFGSRISQSNGEHGERIVRLPSFVAPQSRLLGRLRESISFGLRVSQYLRKHLPDVDVIYANTWPLFSQAFLARYCVQRGIPLVLHIQDIYPESLVDKLPQFCRGIVSFPLTVLDRWTTKRAARVVVISENMRRTYLTSRSLPLEKLVMRENWLDESLFANVPPRDEACRRYGIPSDLFTFLYMGNIGPVAGVASLIEAFYLAGAQSAQMVIAGDGSEKSGCIALCEHLGARNVRFISDPDAASVPLIHSLGHVFLLPIRKGAAMSSIPSKLIAYLFSARPVLATVDSQSDTARCIHEAECGWVGHPEQKKWMSEKMKEVCHIPMGILTEMGERGRIYGLRHFSKAEGVQSLAAFILESKRSVTDRLLSN